MPKTKKEEAPAKVKTRAFRSEKAVLKAIHGLKKKNLHFTHLPGPKTLRLWRGPKYHWKSAPRRNKLDLYAIVRFPQQLTSHEEDKTLVFIVDVKANKHQIKPTEKTLCHWCGQSQYPHNAWWREGLCPAGSALLGSGCVSRIGIVSNESSWLTLKTLFFSAIKK